MVYMSRFTHSCWHTSIYRIRFTTEPGSRSLCFLVILGTNPPTLSFAAALQSFDYLTITGVVVGSESVVKQRHG